MIGALAWRAHRGSDAGSTVMSEKAAGRGEVVLDLSHIESK
jgi:hypothetical protein